MDVWVERDEAVARVDGHIKSPLKGMFLADTMVIVVELGGPLTMAPP